MWGISEPFRHAVEVDGRAAAQGRDVGLRFMADHTRIRTLWEGGMGEGREGAAFGGGIRCYLFFPLNN